MDKNKAVIFDIYNTLIAIKTDEEDLRPYEFAAKWLSYKGVKIDAREFQQLYRKIIRGQIDSSAETYPDVEIGEVIAGVLKIAGYAVEGKEGSRLIEELALLFRILTTKSLTIFPETKKVLEELSTKVRMAIVSNSQRLFTVPELVRFDIAKYFEHIVISSDLRARKPSPKIFQRALDALKVSPANAIYVGDNLFDDVWGAKNLGMKTVWINHGASPNVSVQKGLPAPDVEVADIGDVVKYVCAECQ